MKAATPGGRAISGVSRAPARRVVPAAILAAVLTAGVRAVLVYRSFDLFGDEALYAGLGRSVMSGGWPHNVEGPFFLHPPGFFYLEAGWGWLLPNPADAIAATYQMRLLNLVLAAVTAAVLVLLASRAASLRAGMVTGLLFALDPFVIRQNDRVLLETAMMLWVLLGYLVLAPAVTGQSPRGGWLRAGTAGLLFGAAVMIKDEAALLTVLPMLAVAALGWSLPRRLALLAAAVPAAVYGVYVAVAAGTGQLATLWEAKTSGVRRLLGVEQITGFNQPGSPSLAARLVAEARYFSPSYLMLLLAVPALVLLLRRRDGLLRLLALLEIAAAVTLAYAIIVGTIEEFALYLLMVPSLLIVAVAATHWLARRRQAGRRGWVPAIAVLAAVLCADLTAAVWWSVVPDNGYARLWRYLTAHVPAGTPLISVDAPPGGHGSVYWLLSGRYRVGTWVAPAARAREGARYVVVPWGEVDQHYCYLRPARARALVRPGELLFSFHGRTYGELTLYRLPPAGGR